MSVSTPAASEWSLIGRGGKVVPFPPDAIAAFGRRSGGLSRVKPTSSEFPSDAAAAFGRRSGKTTASSTFGHHDFDDAASAAFGRRQGAHGGAGFDDAASAAFGRNGRDGFGEAASSAFGKRSRYHNIDDGKTPLQRHMESVRAAEEAAKPVPTYEEAFPTLGGKAATVAAPVAPSKPTYASFAKKLAESDAAADREKERRAAEEAERERRERLDRQSYVSMYSIRRRDIAYNEYEDDANVEMETEAPVAGDLDYDAYGRRRADIDYQPPAASDDSSTETDETEEEDTDA